MPKIIVTDPDTGAQYPAALPTGWDQVPLSSLVTFQQRHTGHAPELAPLHAVQALLPELPAELFANDVALAFHLAPALSWYFEGLPEGEPLRLLDWQGVSYALVTSMEKLSVGQFEALLAFIDAAEGNQVAAAPHLLAVLYQPVGAEQDADSIARAAEAFASLPVSIAWPAVRLFLTGSARAAQLTLVAGLARQELEQTMTTTEAALAEAAVASPRRSSRIAARLGSQYVRFVRGRLKN